MNTKLIPIYDIEAINNLWSTIFCGMEEILKHSGEDVSLSSVINNILARRVMLYVVISNDGIVGFVTARVVNIPERDAYFHIDQVFISKGSPSEVWFEGADILRQYAKELGCTKVKMTTRRSDPGSAYEKRLLTDGWSRGYIEWEKEA